MRIDIFDDGDNAAFVSTGVGDRGLEIGAWMESHSHDGGRGAHLVIREQFDSAPLVVHLSRVPALVAALTEVSLRLAQQWERHGESYWAGQPVPPGASPQDPAVVTTEPSIAAESERDEVRRQRRAAKRELLDLVYAHAPDVLACVLAAEDDDDAAAALAELLGVSSERATELITHLQFRELTKAARRRLQTT